MTALNLKAYLDRVGFSGVASPALETLQQLHFRHALTIPFENLNPLLGWAVQLDPASLEQKIVHEGRGGYCYEQNLLFKHALESIGFRVTGLAARVVWNMPADAILPRTHMLVRVDVDGQPYIGDVGFGGLTLTAPLLLEAGIEQFTPHESFRLLRDGEEFIMQANLAGAWKPLYRFALQEQLLPDYEMANWYVSRHPKSRFVNGLIVARPAADKRYALANNEFSEHYIDGRTERRKLESVGEIRRVLEGPFGLTLPDAAELDVVLGRFVLL
jgi:N-hydroxyarylamine O-acetyltransferase